MMPNTLTGSEVKWHLCIPAHMHACIRKHVRVHTHPCTCTHIIESLQIRTSMHAHAHT